MSNDMYVKPSPLNYAVLLVLLAFCSKLHAEPMLNGLSIYSELGSEQFIAAVYADTPTSSARQLLLSNENKAMELRVLTEKLYSRKFKRLWIEGIAINAGPSDVQKHAQDLADFSSILRVKIKQDDILRIERVMGEGTIVSLNDFILGTIKNTRFFDLLLRTWIGPVPLSSDFKQTLLANGHAPTLTLKRFQSIGPSESRLASLSKALIEEQQEITAVAPPAEPSEPSTSVAATAKPLLINPASSTALQTKTEPRTPVSASPIPSAQPSGIPALTPNKSILPLPLRVKPPKIVELEDEGIFDDEEEESKEEFSAGNLLSQQIYISKLTKWTGQFVQYPRHSIRNGHEGSVRLRVELSRNGRVKKVETTDASKHDRLNKAALKAVKSASPYPSIPEEVKGDTFSFTVPVVFRLN